MKDLFRIVTDLVLPVNRGKCDTFSNGFGLLFTQMFVATKTSWLASKNCERQALMGGHTGRLLVAISNLM